MPRPSSTELPLTAAAAGLRVAIRLTPRAFADRIDGAVSDAGGNPVLKVLVAAPAVENRANDALLHLLAREWGLPRRDLALAGGGKGRNKTVLIAGDPAVLRARLEVLLAAMPRR